MFEAAGLLHFHPEVLHVGKDHILHRLAERGQSEEEKNYPADIRSLKKKVRRFRGETYRTTSHLLWAVMPTCNIDYG